MLELSDIIKALAVRIGGEIPKRPLGKTGLQVTMLGLGGESLIKINEKYEDAVNLIQSAYRLGINYFDTAPGYYPSEIRVGDALKDVRKDVIIATKTEDRTRTGSMRSLEQSLKNLHTDYIDIWQIHHIDHKEEVEAIFGTNGVMEALVDAKKQGKVRFIGITGHYDPIPLKEAINKFQFDTVLMAVNAADVHQHSFITELLPEAVRLGMGIIGMKVCARGRIFDPTSLNSMKQALSYVWSLPVSTAIVGHDNIRQLVENARIASEFIPLTPAQMQELEKKTEGYANLALYFRKGFEKFNPFWKPYGFK